MNSDTAFDLGVKTRFSQLSIGDPIPEISRGPLIAPHLMRWSAAIENWHRIHYDLPFATDHDRLPGLLVNGSWKQHFLVQVVREFAEPEGWVSQIAFQFRRMDVAPTTLTAWGVVTGLEVVDGLGHVQLDIGIRNEHGVESTPGTASVVLPASPGDVVPYPFPVEQSTR